MADDFLSILAGIAIRSAIMLLLALGAARLLVGRSAAVRHAVFTAAVVGVVLLPAVTVALPGVHAPFVMSAVSSGIDWLERPIRSLRSNPVRRPAPRSEVTTVDNIALESPEEATAASRGSLILSLLWAAGVLIVGARTLVRVIRASRLTARAQPIRDPVVLSLASAIAQHQGMRRAPWILESAEVSAPATTGILRSVVLLPATRSWSDEYLGTVLAHEVAHVSRRDCLTQHLAKLACALYWFNPLVWVVERRMALERERACDDIAMGQGNTAEGYAMLLLDVARRTYEGALPHAAVLAMARPSELESRLMAILDPARDRAGMTWRARGTLAAVAAVTVAACGAARLDQASPVHLEPIPAEPNVAESVGAPPMLVRTPEGTDRQPVRRTPQLRSSQSRGEPDTRGDSVADPESERIARASLDVARRRGRVALGGPDSLLAHVLLMALEREPRSREDLVRERAAWALSQVRGDRLIEPLIDALEHENWRVRAYAAWSLGPARDSRAVPALVRQMRHPVWRLRAMAAHALSETSDPRARSVMDVAATDEAWQVRMEAIQYLAQFSDPEARARVLAARRDRHIAVRQAAEQAFSP